VAQKNDALDQLRSSLLRELASSLFAHTLAAVRISDARTGAVLFERNSGLLLHPASNAKLFTAAAAFTRLPTNFAFETPAFAESGAAEGIRLWLRGAGDPLISMEDIQNLAQKIRASGITRISAIAYDGSVFDTLPHTEGWMLEDVSDEYGPWISAFPFDRNKCILTLTAPQQRGAPLAVVWNPSCLPLSVSMQATAGQGEKLGVAFDPWAMRVTLTGSLPPGGRKEVGIALSRPREAFHCALLAALDKVGISVASAAALSGTVPSGLTPIAGITHTLDELAAYINKRSDNLCAESLLKRLGAEVAGRPGTTNEGLAAERAALGRLGADTARIALVDGSGMSFYNVTSASALGEVLQAMYVSAQKTRFIASLAKPGEEGTLRKRLAGSRGSEWVHAKTGSIRGVSALSGYVLPPEGTPLVFVLLMQNFTGDNAPYKAAQDRIVMHCIEYSASRRVVIPSR
jgi:D-alanyl-D-alanine carboxypeptidase/D-alanyl-D-alanine-endopeptidase (penicillin-binding protein 4)